MEIANDKLICSPLVEIIRGWNPIHSGIRLDEVASPLSEGRDRTLAVSNERACLLVHASNSPATQRATISKWLGDGVF